MRPQGVLGYLIAFVRPPWGWSTGFRATPRTIGLRPNERQKPLLVFVSFRLTFNAEGPGSTKLCIEKNFLTPEGRRTRAECEDLSTETTRAEQPALRTYWTPCPGTVSRFEIFFNLRAEKRRVNEQAVRRRIYLARGPLKHASENIRIVSNAGR